MAKKNRIKFESRFPQVRKAAREAVDAAVDEALTSGQETGQAKLEASGYDLDPFELRRKNFGSGEGGMLFVRSDKWYYRFFEYGTVYIAARPFLRPTNRVMRKTFVAEMDDKFEGFVRRKVGRV